MNIYEKINELITINEPYTLATIVKTSGSVPGKVGFKILVEADGKSTGTVGGGEIEKRVIEESTSRIDSGNSGLQEYVLQEKDTQNKKQGEAEIVPMMCNGKVWVYYEVNARKTPIYLFGGGHVGQALSVHLSTLNFRVILVDNREEFVGEAKNPFVHERILADYIHQAQEFSPPDGAYIVIMTQGHNYDYQILRTLLERNINFSYIGVIASRSKAEKLKSNLKKDLGDDLDLSSVYTPIGLDLGGSTDGEIALSIAAEIQAIRYGKIVPHLRLKA